MPSKTYGSVADGEKSKDVIKGGQQQIIKDSKAKTTSNGPVHI